MVRAKETVSAMTELDRDDWAHLMRRHDICLIVAARKDGTQVLRLGEEIPEHVERLAGSLFGDTTETAELAASLVGRLPNLNSNPPKVAGTYDLPAQPPWIPIFPVMAASVFAAR